MPRLFCLPRKCPAVSAVTGNVPAMAGFAFLAVVLNVFYRRAVGWAMAMHLRADLLVDALDMALYRGKPSGALHHSNQRSRYTSRTFTNRGESADVRPSIESLGDCNNYAMCESFNATLECK